MNFILKCTLFFLPLFAQTVDVSKEQALQGPAWMQEGVIYSLFVRDFSPTGDFDGVTEKLTDLKQLGVTIVWLLPIHPIGKQNKKGSLGSPFSIQDYYAIDPAYGTKADLKKLIQKAHELGLKVIIDAVLNHTAWDSILMKNPQFYKRNAQNQITSPLPDWSDVAALNYSNPKVRSYMIDMLKYWLKEFDLDGFRFDAASFIPLDFWEQVRGELHQVKSDILMLGEEDQPEALVKAFDLDYDWRLEEVLNDVMTNGAPATKSLQSVLAHEKEIFPQNAWHLRFLDNHDKKRAITRFGEKGTLAASLFIFTLRGVPLLYNGMEVGNPSESTGPALFEKLPIFWKSKEIRPEFLYFYQQVIVLRKNHPALREGETVWLTNSAPSRVVTYLRKTDQEELLIAINLSNRPFTGTVDIENGKEFEDLTSALTSAPLENQTPSPILSLKAWEYRVFKTR